MLTARLAGTAFVVCLALAVPIAYADNGPPQGVSSIAEYVEVVPTSVGPRAMGGGNGHVGTLSRAAADTVRRLGGRDAHALKRIATSPGLGAPSHTRKPGSSTLPALPRLARFGAPSPFGAVEAGVRSFRPLFAILLALTLGASAAAGWRRRTPRGG